MAVLTHFFLISVASLPPLFLGLRLFSHPWVGVDENGNATSKGPPEQSLQTLGYSKTTASALLTMGHMNRRLSERSKDMLRRHVSAHVSPAGLVGSADFNLTLVNRMEPTSAKRDMKKEVAYGMGKTRYGDMFTPRRSPEWANHRHLLAYRCL